MSENEFVRVRRPNGTDLEISRLAYQGVYQYRGWTLVDAPAPPAEAEQDRDLPSLTRDELNAMAEQAGVADPDKLANKAAVIEAIRSA